MTVPNKHNLKYTRNLKITFETSLLNGGNQTDLTIYHDATLTTANISSCYWTFSSRHLYRSSHGEHYSTRQVVLYPFTALRTHGKFRLKTGGENDSSDFRHSEKQQSTPVHLGLLTASQPHRSTHWPIFAQGLLISYSAQWVSWTNTY